MLKSFYLRRIAQNTVSLHRVVDECTQRASMHARVHAFVQRHAVCLLPVNYSNRYRLYLYLYARVCATCRETQVRGR